MAGIDEICAFHSAHPIKIKWKICILCQDENSTEKLVNPSIGKENGISGYASLTKNLIAFDELQDLPMPVDLRGLDCGDGLYESFLRHKVLWHKTCYLKFNNSKLERAQKRRQAQGTNQSPKKTRKSEDTAYDVETCIICGLQGSRLHPLSAVQTKTCSNAIIECATVLNDSKMLAKVMERHDLMSLEGKYHNKCLTALKNRRKSAEPKSESNDYLRQIYGITYSRLIAYMNEERELSKEPVFFNLAQLARFQSQYMRELGVSVDIHSTRLKEKLLRDCPYLLSIERKGQATLITFKEDVNFVISSMATRDYNEEGKSLCEAAQIVRADIFSEERVNLETAPSSLLALINMILYGPASNAHDDSMVHHLAELVTFHAMKNPKRGVSRRHLRSQETDTPVYLASKLYAETRKKSLIDYAFKMGMCISYDRLQSLLIEKGNERCEMYHQDGVVCPPKLKKNIFVTAAVDNIDYNPSSTTAQSAFHGTAITLMQHKFPFESGLERQFVHQTNDVIKSEKDVHSKKKKLMDLPANYATVSPCFIDVTRAPCSLSTNVHCNPLTVEPLTQEKGWLESNINESCQIWEAYHTPSDRSEEGRHSTEVALLPVFYEQAHSTAMMMHTMKVVMDAVKFLNPNQTPVVVADQPLYTKLKQIQYTCPDSFGEKKLFVMMGPLHVELTMDKVLGQFLDGSGWVESLVQANVTSQGRAESLLSGSHITRGRYAHQVTAVVLYSLLMDAYCMQLSDEIQPSPKQTFEEWCNLKKEQTPQFSYWFTVLNLELLLLQTVRSLRTGNFGLYVDSLRRMVPWFFALDHVHYARWTAVHLRDLINLEELHPELHKKFHDGLFVARITERPFSGMALDQAHEQMNSILKGDGGMIGITENPEALRKWLISGPALTDMVHSYERDVLKIHFADAKTSIHHNDTRAMKTKFERDVQSMRATLKDLGNPFLEESKELYNISTRRVATDSIVQTIFKIEKCGDEQYKRFAEERLKSGKNLLDPIKLNKFPLFGSSVKSSQSNVKTKIRDLKNNCSLFSRLYIATCSHRDGDLDNFFSHENQQYPPSLALSTGSIRSCAKSDIIKCLLRDSKYADVAEPPHVTMKILDGAAIVHILSPSAHCKTFADYAGTIFLPFIRRELSNTLRVDVVWDAYIQNSLKTATREKRGSGDRMKVAETSKIPKGWINFLRSDLNKEELFSLLSRKVTETLIDGQKEVYCTDGSLILSNIPGRDVTGTLSPCNHEESDTRMMVHVADGVSEGHSRIMVRSVDSDVVVLAVAAFQKLEYLEELWLHIGTGKRHQYIACHEIANSLGPEISGILPLFHAFTGCDTVSSFNGRGKITAYDALKSFPHAVEGFEIASTGNIDAAMPILEKFVVTMYDKCSPCSSVNECRRYLFTKKDRQIDNIPPTQAVLKEHLRRAVYQGSFVWGQSTKLVQTLPSPLDWGWKIDESGSWCPKWSSFPILEQACLELIRCKCKVKCSEGRCNCLKNNVKCTDLCLCGGNC